VWSNARCWARARSRRLGSIIGQKLVRLATKSWRVNRSDVVMLAFRAKCQFSLSGGGISRDN
jgi:hypothetical protein